MANIDENVEVGIELTTTTVRLGAKTLIAIMDYFLNLQGKEKHYQDLTTKQGQQKVKELFEKNQNSGVEALGSNVSKKEVSAITKELKSMGVDFSSKKIGKDNYSVFFAGKDREAVEAGLRNAIEKFALKNQRIDTVKDILFSSSKKEQSEEEIEKMDSHIEDLIEGKTEAIKNEPKIFSEAPTEKQLHLAEKMGVPDYKNMNKIEISLALEKAGADKSFFDRDMLDNLKNNKNDKPQFTIKELQKKSREHKKNQKQTKVKSKRPTQNL